MQILVLLGMYFDAAVVFVTSQTLLFRLALSILCPARCREHFEGECFMCKNNHDSQYGQNPSE